MNNHLISKVLVFITEQNIDNVTEIFNNKVDSESIEHLRRKADYHRNNSVGNRNTEALLNFIGSLDEVNKKILFDYIENK